MPIVMPSGGVDKITVEIDGKVDDLLADIKKANKALDGFIDQNRKADKSAGLTAAGATANWTDFRSAYSTVLDVIRTGQQVWDATVGELVEYGDQVRKLSTITGQNAEETSRQIQMADDLRVSYEALARGLQFASRKGIDTSIDGLVKLGEEYKKLPKGIERTQFLMEKFGRQGVELGKILGETSDTIRDLAANTPDGLILNDSDLQTLKLYNQNVDALGDSFTALKMSVAKDALPAIIDFTNGLQVYIKLQSQFFDAVKSGNLVDFYKNFGKNLRAAQNEIVQNTLNASRAVEDLSGEYEDGTTATDEYTEGLKRQSQVFTGLLSSMFAIQSANDKYQESIDNVAKKEIEFAEQKKRITYEMSLTYAAGKMTTEMYNDYMIKLADVTKAEQDNSASLVKLEEDRKKAAKQRLYDLVQQKLAADGLIDSGEYDYLQNLAVAQGLVSRATADAAIADNAKADAMVANFDKTEHVMRENLNVLNDIARYDGQVFHVGLDFQSNLASTMFSQIPTVTGVSNAYTNYGTRAEGGTVTPGSAYLVGERGPEMFIPQQGGSVIPNDRLGNNIQINIASITNRSDVDYLAQEVARRLAKV